MPKSAVAPRKKAAPAKKAAAARPAPPQQDAPDILSSDDWFVGVEDIVEFLNLLYYGREGSAKTTNAARIANAASHLPKGKGKVLVINAEGGLKRKPLIKRGVDMSRIVLWPDPKKHERVSRESLQKIFQRVKSDLLADPDSWFAVIFDSASEIHISFLDTVTAKRVASMLNRGMDVDEDFVDRSDYGTMSKMFRQQLRNFRDLPCHFIVTALERRDVDSDTSKPTYGPAVTPGLQSDLLGYVDMVIMCKAEDEDGPFRGLTRANSRYRAKDRFDTLPKVMVEPHADRIIDYLNDTIDEETDPEQKRYTAQGKDVNKSKTSDSTEDDEADDDE